MNTNCGRKVIFLYFCRLEEFLGEDSGSDKDYIPPETKKKKIASKTNKDIKKEVKHIE